MKAPCLLTLIVIQISIDIADCCSSDTNMAVSNAYVSCLTNMPCVAKCYPGYIFPSGSTKKSYSCQNGEWTPFLSSCKRIPSVSVTYSAVWGFADVLTSACKNISLRLNSLQELLEETFAKNCILLDINSTVHFTYSFLAFQVHTHFKAVYHNFTSWKKLVVCIDYNRDSFQNLKDIKSIFEGVTCGNTSTSNKIITGLHVKKMYDICPNATVLHNVTTSEDGNYMRYCDFADIDSTIKTTKSTTATTQMSTPERPTMTTEVSFTDNDFNISESTTLGNEVLPTKEISNISHGTTLRTESSSNKEKIMSQSTTLRTEGSSTDQNSNISQITTITAFSSKKDLKVKSIIYIAASAGGVFLISIIIIIIVCLRKRVKDPETLTDDIKMTRETKHRKDETSFKGEMIENKLYNSADDVLDWDSKADNTSAAKGDFSAAPYLKEETRRQVKVDQYEYSYPSKISKFKEARLNVESHDDTDGDSDVKARDILQSPNQDSENSCEYAVVNKSRKI